MLLSGKIPLTSLRVSQKYRKSWVDKFLSSQTYDTPKLMLEQYTWNSWKDVDDFENDMSRASNFFVGKWWPFKLESFNLSPRKHTDHQRKQRKPHLSHATHNEETGIANIINLCINRGIYIRNSKARTSTRTHAQMEQGHTAWEGRRQEGPGALEKDGPS